MTCWLIKFRPDRLWLLWAWKTKKSTKCLSTRRWNFFSLSAIISDMYSYIQSIGLGDWLDFIWLGSFELRVWVKQDLFVLLHSIFKTEYNQLHNKPNGLYKYSSNIKHTKWQTWTFKTRRMVIDKNRVSIMMTKMVNCDIYNREKKMYLNNPYWTDAFLWKRKK